MKIISLCGLESRVSWVCDEGPVGEALVCTGCVGERDDRRADVLKAAREVWGEGIPATPGDRTQSRSGLTCQWYRNEATSDENAALSAMTSPTAPTHCAIS